MLFHLQHIEAIQNSHCLWLTLGPLFWSNQSALFLGSLDHLEMTNTKSEKNHDCSYLFFVTMLRTYKLLVLDGHLIKRT
jgi:hypothetical protein